MPQVACYVALLCVTKASTNTVLGQGDGTVPTLSHSPWGTGTYETNDTPHRQVIQFASQTPEDDANYAHVFFPNNPAVLDKVLDLLVRSEPPNTSAAHNIAGAATVAATPPSFYKLKINGATAVSVSDQLGRSTAPISGTDILGAVPGVSTYTLGGRIEQMIIPATGAYSITFRTTNEPLALESTFGTNTTATRAVRYQDLSMPQGVMATLTFTAQGLGPLRYDADGNGSFETTVPPTISVSGAQASDVEPPDITVQTTNVHSPTLTINLSAQDSGSGVQKMLYSLDGTHYQRYTGPFQAHMVASPNLYIFADDNLANRRALVYSLAQATNQHYEIYLPLTRR